MWKLIDKIEQREKQNSPFFSLEFFPPRTKAGAVNLFSRFDRLAAGGPLFIDITWGAGGGDPELDECTGSLSVASTSLNYCGLPTMLHLTAIGKTKAEILKILQRAKDAGIRNILALRGDMPNDENFSLSAQEMKYGVDLVKLIKSEYKDYFGICVAGYPNGHPDCTSFDDDLQYLKEKVDAGADFIITQLFFETQTFVTFVNRCREIGIKCPIIPGILPIQSYASLRHLMKLSKLRPPDSIVEVLEQKKDDDAAIRAFGVDIAARMCKELLASKLTIGFHFYTLNREVAVKEILLKLDMWKPTLTIKEKPWLTSANEKRANESIRPIFWSGRPKSYLMRTKDWDEFPNGRWGDSSSPAFGNLSEYYLFKTTDSSTKEQRLNMWGRSFKSVLDIGEVFCKYLEGKVSRLPWSEELSLAPETKSIQDRLIELNRRGILTTNSQPAVNGISSSDPVYGWGGEGGYVYQKAYLEFFICPCLFWKLVDILQNNFPWISYHAMNRVGKNFTNTPEKAVNAVTWGVFPGKEIIQPTVVDPESFPIWKDEAFEQWKDWGNLYEEDSRSRHIIDNIYDSYFLVNLVDNDFVNGDIFAPFAALKEEERTC